MSKIRIGSLSIVLLVLLFQTSCGKQFLLKKDPSTSILNKQTKNNSNSPNEVIGKRELVVWPIQSMPVKLKISQNFSSEEEELIIKMAKNWEKSIGLPENSFFYFDEQNLNTQNYYYDLNQYKDNEMGIYPIQNWFEEIPPRTIGLTQYFGYRINKNTPDEKIELVHADIFLNTEFYVFNTDEKNQWTSYDLGTVVLHELGHFLGLPHGIERPSVMGEYLTYLEDPRFPTPIDQAKLKKNYQFLFHKNRTRNIPKQNEELDNNSDKEFVSGVYYILKGENHVH